MLFNACCACLCSTQTVASSPKSQDYQNDNQKDGQSKQPWGAWWDLISVHQDISWKLDNNTLTDEILRRGQVHLPTTTRLLTRRAVLQLRFREAWREKSVPCQIMVLQAGSGEVEASLLCGSRQPLERRSLEPCLLVTCTRAHGDSSGGMDTLCPWLLVGRKMLKSSMLKSR